MEINLRNATFDDIPYIVETIVEAEKSGTSVFSYTTIFGLTEEESKKYIALMLEEEIDGCELSISAFLLAVKDGQTVGAVCAWIEGKEGVPSTALKGNLLRFILPKKCFESLADLNNLIKELHIEYIPGSIQIGLVYISEEARGKGLVQHLLHQKINNLRDEYPSAEKVYIQVFGNNISAIRAYEKLGFKTIDSKKANHKEILKYLPSDTKILMKL